MTSVRHGQPRTVSELPRSLSPIHALAMVVGAIIGAGIFVQPSEISRHLHTPGQIMLVWLGCGIVTLFGALVCAELSSAFPRTGGVYVYLRETFSPLAGFLWGWAMFWTMHAGIIAAIATIFARYAAHFVPVDGAGTRAIAVLVILALSALNYFGVRASGRVVAALTGAKLAAIAAIVAAGLVYQTPVTRDAAASTALVDVSLSDFLLATVAGLFAYGGWHMVTYTAGETVLPARTIPFALIAGVAIVTACYMALNMVYLAVLPIETVRTSTRIAADAADALVGRGGSTLLSALVMLSTLGALTSAVLAGPRVYYSMAVDGLAFGWLGRIHPVHHTPAPAILAQAGWSSALAATGAYQTLFTRVIYTEWLFFAVMAAGVFVLRRRPGYDPAYRTWGFPVVPIVFVGASLAIVANQVYRQPIEAATGLGLVAMGAPIYYLWHARR